MRPSPPSEMHARRSKADRTIGRSAVAAAVLGGVLIGSAHAETLADALALAYQSNPTLQSQRAQLRAVDETYVQAKAGAGPTAQLQATYAYDTTNQPVSELLPPGALGTTTVEPQLSLTQPVYSGGRTAAAVDVARSRIAAGRALLLATEGNVMLAVIQAYSDVLRDQQELDVRSEHLGLLAQQVDIAKARRAAGEATLTDIAQAEAQAASVRALVTDAQYQLQLSRESYATLVGQNPGDLAPEPDLPGLPGTVDEAFNVAEADNPDLQQAKRTEEISRAQVIAARAAYRPSVSLSAIAGDAFVKQPFFGQTNDWNVAVLATFTAPLFTNGVATSGVREALEQNTSDRIAIETARRTMVQNVANAWNRMITARADVATQQDQVREAGAAYKGMQIEYNAGERSTLDVLLAEETWRNAQLALIVAQHDWYVGAATVLRYVGHLRGEDLVADLPQYDPAKHFRQVRNAGMLPWTGLLLGVDEIALPGAHQHPIPAPPGGTNPQSTPATAEVPADAPLSTALPMTPEQGTASTQPPPAIQAPR